MSTSVFPVLAGLGWDIIRTPIWDTIVQQNTSGKEVRIANQTYPRHQWEITFDFLRQGAINGKTYSEFSQLFGFFNQRQGQFDSFLYTDVDDCSATAQSLGTGDGITRSFQFVRAFGNFVEPVLAPNTVTAIKLNGVTQAGSSYSVTGWGTATPGVVTFATAPAAGASISADFTYYWPCRFTDDKIPFNKFMSWLYSGKKLTLISLKS